MPRTRKLAAIMFTDIAGYTALMQQSEQKAIEIRDRHRSIFNRVTHQYNGQIIQYYGDGTLSIFDSAIEAVQCAKSLQANFLEEPAIPVRIGLHMGDIVLDDEDVIGDAINIASRIESLAVPGSILISNKIYEEIRNQETIKTHLLGDFHFKNDKSPRNVYAIADPYLVVPNAEVLQAGKLHKASSASLGRQPNKKKIISLKYFLGIAALMMLGLVAVWGMQRQGKKNWVRNNLLSEIQQLGDSILVDPPFMEKNRLSWKAYRKALEAEQYIPKNPILAQQWEKITWISNFNSTPTGADVFIKPYHETSAEWVHLGKTPLDSMRLPWGMYTIRISKEGFFETTDVLRRDFWPNMFERNEYTLYEYTLYEEDQVPEGMVPAQGDSLTYRGAPVIFSDFFVDKHEVSNQEYQLFVNAGGYRNPEFWKHPFIKEGDTLSWDEAMLHFVDQSKRPGPATWLAGKYPEGKEDYPVSGVSWYEAAAYAEYAGKSLPTLFHFNKIALFQGVGEITALSNFSGVETTKKADSKSMVRFGVYDVAGNVREWLYNTYVIAKDSEAKLNMGGGWRDPEYTFAGPLQFQNPFIRNETSGFRCIKPLNIEEDFNCRQDVLNENFFDMSKRQPVTDDQFLVLKRAYEYSKKELNAKIESRWEEEEWIKEKIIFEASYVGDPMIAYLYLPKNAPPPYQTIVYFPGIEAFWRSSFDDFAEAHFDFFIHTGRAVLLPIMAGTFERKMGYGWRNDMGPDYSDFFKDRTILMVKDLRRSIDYLETRSDIELDKLGYFGFSQGGAEGPIVLAVEKRIKAAVLVACGLSTTFEKLPEADRANFLPRVKTPALIINNIYDSNFPYEIAQKPFIELLGTDKKDLRVILLEESGHKVPRIVFVKESLAWFDRYFENVNLRSLHD